MSRPKPLLLLLLALSLSGCAATGHAGSEPACGSGRRHVNPFVAFAAVVAPVFLGEIVDDSGRDDCR